MTGSSWLGRSCDANTTSSGKRRSSASAALTSDLATSSGWVTSGGMKIAIIASTAPESASTAIACS